MARTLVIGDIHAVKKALVQVLERAELQADDQLIFLGDYVDAWSEAVETVDFYRRLVHLVCWVSMNVNFGL